MCGFRPVLVAVMRPTFVGPDRPIDLNRGSDCPIDPESSSQTAPWNLER